MVGEALTLAAAHRSNRAVGIVIAESGTVVITEVEFRKVTV
jgi:hypothetical protein